MTPDPASAALVLRVNELFHDLEGAEYANIHPEIFAVELNRWNALLALHLPDAPHPPLHCVDVGCGTGFVSELILNHLQTGDALVCADISEIMLEICRNAFAGNDRGVAVETLKLRDESIGLPDASVDVVMLNSVLHHVPDSQRFLAELVRILKPGGIVMIGHEPNARFWQSRFLRTQYRVLHVLVPKRLAATILKKTWLYGAAVKPKPDVFLDKLNGLLLAEGAIAAPLTRTDVSQLIDIHSPTAGGIRTDEGFDPYTLFDGLPMENLAIETYNHLSKMSDASFLKPYGWLLGRLLPRHGATFFLVTRKKT